MVPKARWTYCCHTFWVRNPRGFYAGGRVLKVMAWFFASTPCVALSLPVDNPQEILTGSCIENCAMRSVVNLAALVFLQITYQTLEMYHGDKKECGIFSNNYHPSSSRQLWISSLFQHYSVKWKPQKQFCCWRQVCSLVKQGLQLQSNLFHKQSSGTNSFKEHPSYQQSNTVSYMLMLILTTQPENEIFRRHKEYWECKVQKFLMEGNSIHTLISSKNAFSKQRCFVLHHSCWLSGGFPLDVGTSCHSNQGQALLCLFYDTGYHESCIQTQEVFIYVEYILK